MVIRYQVFVPNLVFSFDLIDDQLWVTISFKVSYPHFMSELRPISRALYSATLLEQGVVNENARERTWLHGKINTIPTSTIILPLGPVLDSPSKNICQLQLLRSYWIQKPRLEYFHEALSSSEPDELPESLQGPDPWPPFERQRAYHTETGGWPT